MGTPDPNANPKPNAAAAIAVLAAFAALAFACRGGLPGVAVADDYLFLAHQSQAGFDWLGTHGSDWYWRPLSRQAYFALLGPHLVAHPEYALALHVGLLLVAVWALWSFGRRMLGVHGALVLATAPVLMEPVRVLIAWPSAIQHLLPLAGISCALAAAVRGRAALAWLALAVAIGGHENALLVLPAIPLLLARARGRFAPSDAAAAIALAALWGAGRMAAFAHGASLPPTHGMPGLAALGTVARYSLAAFASLEDLARIPAALVLAGYAVAGAALLVGPRAPLPPGGVRAMLGAALVWALATAPLAIFLPEWNSWRNTLPSLALAFVLAALAQTGGARVAWLLVSVRLAALLVSPVPAPLPGAIAPETDTHISFARLTRMQQTVRAARVALAPAPRRTQPWRVRHWNLPRLTEFAFGGPCALQVWSGDPHATFVMYGEAEGMADTAATVVAFDPNFSRDAVVLVSEAQRRLNAANAVVRDAGAAAGDSALAAVLEAQSPPAPRLTSLVLLNRVALNLSLGRLALADSLHRESAAVAWAEQWVRDELRIAAALRDTARFRAGLREGLARLPEDESLRKAATAWGVTPGTPDSR